ncbi:MAG: sulfotransferase [Chitinophagaceae bacterium]
MVGTPNRSLRLSAPNAIARHEENAGMRAASGRASTRSIAYFRRRRMVRPIPRGAGVIFIVSLPRSGSTLIEQILASHSSVEGAGELPDLPLVLGEELRRRGQPLRLGHRRLRATNGNVSAAAISNAPRIGRAVGRFSPTSCRTTGPISARSARCCPARYGRRAARSARNVLLVLSRSSL